MAVLKSCANASRLPHRSLGVSRRARILAALFVGLGAIGRVASQPATPTPEYQVKAVFLFNFTQFVEWPGDAFPGVQAPLIIGVLGNDPFGAYLDETVQAETINGHSLAVRRYRRVDEIDHCHVLFVSRSERPRLRSILAALRNRPILTVSDMEEFATAGGIIRLLTQQNKIRMRINLDAARTAQLTISSKLLRAAEIVSLRGE